MYYSRQLTKELLTRSFQREMMWNKPDSEDGGGSTAKQSTCIIDIAGPRYTLTVDCSAVQYGSTESSQKGLARINLESLPNYYLEDCTLTYCCRRASYNYWPVLLTAVEISLDLEYSILSHEVCPRIGNGLIQAARIRFLLRSTSPRSRSNMTKKSGGCYLARILLRTFIAAVTRLRARRRGL